ncbi:hypothetical protein, partial [Pseudoalteromonas sp. GW168-MNA-CIBAN-0100]|uniref:hypothetical protein n=1 Tax=Pseudoalteromonas sp. GW168-MNA-CIBAN-0100 TaxID=3140434 RepID=UPI00332BBD73
STTYTNTHCLKAKYLIVTDDIRLPNNEHIQKLFDGHDNRLLWLQPSSESYQKDMSINIFLAQ